MFSCCYDRSSIECFNKFSALFHRNGETALLVEDSAKPTNGDATKSRNQTEQQNYYLKAPSEICNAPRSTNYQKRIIGRLPSEKKQKLHQIFEHLVDRYQNEDVVRDECTGQATEEVHKSSLPRPSFTYELALAASKVSLQVEKTKLEENNDSEDGTHSWFNGDNPEAAIQKLLQVGKQTEFLKQQQSEFIAKVQWLDENYPALFRPLNLCWADVENALRHRCATQHAFLNVSSVLLGDCEVHDILDVLWQVVDREQSDLKEDNTEGVAERKIEGLIRLCFNHAVAQSFLTASEARDSESRQQSVALLMQSNKERGANDDDAIQSMLDSFWDFHWKQLTGSSKFDDTLLRQHFLQWHETHTPSLLVSVSMCLDVIFFPVLSVETRAYETQGWLLPHLDEEAQSDSFLFSSSSGPVSSWLYALACILPVKYHRKVGTNWHRLYCTNSEGFNLSALERGITGYHGPTLILLQAFDSSTKTNKVFGAFASQPWKKQDSHEFYGDEQCFLFQLLPSFKVFRAKSELEYAHVARNFQYFYFREQTKTPSSQSKFAHGIGLGGSQRRPRFFVSSTLDTCCFAPSDATFENNENNNPSSFLADPFMAIRSLEIWGVGGEEAIQARQKHRVMREAYFRRARQVDKSAFLGDFRSGLVESKMFAFYDDLRNRDGGCVLDFHDE